MTIEGERPSLYLGRSISIDGDRVAVGVNGGVRVYDLSRRTYRELDLPPEGERPDEPEYFGGVVALHGHTLFVGAGKGYIYQTEKDLVEPTTEPTMDVMEPTRDMTADLVIITPSAKSEISEGCSQTNQSKPGHSPIWCFVVGLLIVGTRRNRFY